MEEKELAKQCLSCPKPLCQSGCPVGNLIRDFVAEVKNDSLNEAAAILYSTNPFPEITSLLCDHKRQCQGHCVKGIRGKAVEIPSIEGFIASSCPRDLSKKPSNNKRIAIIGAGIAGLSAAWFLEKEGFEVEVFEKENALGGAIYTGIPSHRFSKEPLEKIHEDLASLGVAFHFGVEIGSDLALEKILSEFDSVLLCLGANKENLPSFKADKGFIPGLELLYKINVEGETYSDYSTCVVWGGGNVAMDCARSLRKLGKDVTLVYRRSRKEMPANDCEVEEAEKEGVKFAFLSNVTDLIKNESDEVVGLNLVKMELGEKDASGRASFHEVPGSSYALDCDLLVPAIGQKADLSKLGIAISIGEGHKTNIDRLFVSGDCFLGPKNIASCIKDGRLAAFEIIDSFRKG